jgi:hypothetical protein
MNYGVIVKRGALPCPVDLEGRYTAEVWDWEGR